MAFTYDLAIEILTTLSQPVPHEHGPNTSLLDLWPVLLAALALIWGIREWIYGGSVLVVKLELGFSDGRALIRGAPIDFKEPGALQRLFDKRITNPALDLAVVTVTNRGRTPATILRPGLQFTMSGVKPVVVEGILLGDLGEASARVRIEAHDSCTFVMPLGGMVATARSDTDFQKAESMSGALRARAHVTSGTGRAKRSAKRTWRDNALRNADWTVQLPLRGKPLLVEEELLDSFVDPRSALYDQFLFMGGLLLQIRAGQSDPAIIASFGSIPGVAMERILILNRARSLLDSSPGK